jgi:hypothetical protein
LIRAIEDRPAVAYFRKVTATTWWPQADGSNVDMGAVGDALLADRPAMVEEITRLIFDNEPAYDHGRALPESELAEAIWANITEAFASIGGKSVELTVFEATGRKRAKANIPLHAVLHAYRLAAQLEWERFVQLASTMPHRERVILEGTARLWQINGTAAERVTVAYCDAVEQGRRRSLSERNALIDMLLTGEFATGSDLWDAAQALQLPVTGEFVVVVAETTTSQTPLQGAARAIAAAHGTGVWRIQGEAEVGLISLAGGSSADRTAKLIDSVATGSAGMSDPFRHLRLAPEALRQARIACDAGRGNPPGATLFSAVPLQAMLVVTPSAAEDLRIRVLGPLLNLADSERQALIETVHAWARAGGSVSECARAMYLHRNSVHRRLQHVYELTGRDPQTPIGMAELYAAVEADRMLSQQITPRQRGQSTR